MSKTNDQPFIPDMSFIDPEPDGKTIDFSLIIGVIKRRWPIFAASVLVCLTTAFIYLRYASPLYSVTATVYLKEKTGMNSGVDAFMEGMQLFQPNTNIDNQMILMTSANMVGKAMDQLNFNYSYFKVGRVKDVELYPNTLFRITPDVLTPQLLNARINIIPKSAETFLLRIDEEKVYYYDVVKDSICGPSVKPIKIEVQGTYGKPIDVEGSRFIVNAPGANEIIVGEEYYYYFQDQYTLTKQWQGAIAVSTINKNASIVAVTVSGQNPVRSVEFLNALCQVYIQAGLDEKNQIAVNTINFIDLQLGVIRDSLNIAEKDLVDFRTRNKVMNIAYESQQDYTQLKELESEKVKLQIRQKYFQYLKKYVSEDEDYSKLIAPSTMDINDANLNHLIEELSTLFNEKQALMQNSPSENNPFVKNINSKIHSLKDAIIENLNNLNKVTDISMHELDLHIARVQASLSKLPLTEQAFINIERKFAVNDATYNYLLEKRAEAGIAKATSTPDNKIVDLPTIYDAVQISHQRSRYFVIAFIVGLTFPMLLLLVLYYLDTKIDSKEEVEENTKLPFLGSILHNDYHQGNTILDKPKSGVAESFRSVKVNLDFMYKSAGARTIGVTSSLSGEGKTFLALNLACIYAFSGKRVVLVNMDLRRPRMDKELFADKEAGLSNYLAGMVPMEKIIHPTDKHAGFFFIPAGTVPPNPSELLSSPRVSDLLVHLRKNFDIIILDSSPVGLVVDYLNVVTEVDTTLFVVRQGYTDKKSLQIINDLYKRKQITNVGIVLNDAKMGYRSYYGYGMAYSYGRYSGYYTEGADNRSFWKKLNIFNR